MDGKQNDLCAKYIGALATVIESELSRAATHDSNVSEFVLKLFLSLANTSSRILWLCK